MYLGDRIGWRFSETLREVWPNLMGEWVWSKAVFGEEANPQVDEVQNLRFFWLNANCHLLIAAFLTFFLQIP